MVHTCPSCGGTGIVSDHGDPESSPEGYFSTQTANVEEAGQTQMSPDDEAWYAGLEQSGQDLLNQTQGEQAYQSYLGQGLGEEEAFDMAGAPRALQAADLLDRSYQDTHQGQGVSYTASDSGDGSEGHVDFGLGPMSEDEALDQADQANSSPYDPEQESIFEVDDPGRIARQRQRQAMIEALRQGAR